MKSDFVQLQDLKFEMVMPGGTITAVMLIFPTQNEIVLDPLHILSTYTSCTFCPRKSNFESKQLQGVYKYVTRIDLQAAQTSCVCVNTLTTAVESKLFYIFHQ